MKKKTEVSKLSLDKETIARLSKEQLLDEQTKQIQGGATAYTGGASCCYIGETYTSCPSI